MTIDALRGRGAYRCGCGAGVLVELMDRPDARCAVADCRGEPKAQVPIVFLCDEHLDRLILGLMPQFYAKYPVHEWFRTVRKYEMEFGELPDSTFPEWLMRQAATGIIRPDTRHEPIVYFLAIGDKVKIGTTINKRQVHTGVARLIPT